MRAVVAVVVLVLATLLLSFRVFDGSMEAQEPDVPTVAPGELSSAGVPASAQEGRVAVSVYVAAGPDTQAVSMAQVWVPGTLTRRLTDEDGQTTFSLRPGVFTARATVPGFSCPPVQFTVRPRESVNVQIICPVSPAQVPDTVVYISVDTLTGIVSVTPDRYQ